MRLNLARQSVRFRVHDWSMAPAFVPGDIIRVALPIASGATPRRGDAIVFWDPEMRGRKLLKRVESVESGKGSVKVFVIGDNALRSRDSRHFGSVPIEQVIGRVVETCLPASRSVGGQST